MKHSYDFACRTLIKPRVNADNIKKPVQELFRDSIYRCSFLQFLNRILKFVFTDSVPFLCSYGGRSACYMNTVKIGGLVESGAWLSNLLQKSLTMLQASYQFVILILHQS